MVVNGFTVSTLLFSDYPDLASRCLGRLVDTIDPALVVSLRIGMNAVSPATSQVVSHFCKQIPASVEVLVYDAGEANRLKYPLLRKILLDADHPVITPWFMHFDDDSCLQEVRSSSWWRTVHDKMQGCDMIGSVYRKKVLPQQVKAIQQQPWYKGKTIGEKIYFATGGWWTVRTRILQQWDYPFKDLIHNGGDVMLGALLHQQGLKLKHDRCGVLINADQQGRESKAVRRGVTMKPLWSDFGSRQQSSQDYHDFVVQVFDPRKRWIHEGKSDRVTVG